MKFERKPGFALIAAALLGVTPFAAATQSGAGPEGGSAGDVASGLVLDEVIVSAQKRNEAAQDIPISIGVVQGDDLGNLGVTSTADLDNYVPGLVIQQVPGNTSSITVRGLGTAAGNESFDQSVSLFVDGVYAGRQREFSASLFDIERIEVVKGTQNNLLGKNTSLGAISLITREPGDSFGGYVSAEREFKYHAWASSAAVDLPASDKLRFRVAANWVDQDGFVDNIATGNKVPQIDQKTARIKSTYDIADNVDMHLMYQRDELDVLGDVFQPTIDSSGAMQTMDPATDLELDKRKSSYVSAGKHGGDSYEDQEADRAAITININLNDYTLTSLTGYSAYDNRYVNDGDFNAGDYLISIVDSDFDQTTQEVRLTSPMEEDGNFVVGLFVLGSNFRRINPIFADYQPGLHPALPAVTGDVTNHFDQDTFASSLFGQSTWNVTQSQRLTIGMRYTREKKEVQLMRTTTAPTLFSAAVYPTFDLTSLTRSENSFDGSINYQIDFADQQMAYASWGKGTKSGGFSESTTAVEDAEYDSEVAKTTEIGVKTKLLDGRARLNAAIFYTTIDDFQLVFFTGLGFTTQTLPARSKGFEMDGMIMLTEHLSLAGGLTRSDVENSDTGEHIARAPKYSGNIMLRYEQPMFDAVTGSAEFVVNYRDEMYHEMGEVALADSATRYDLRLALSNLDKDWEVALLGKNLGDETVSSYGFKAPIVLDESTQIESLEARRTYAIQAKYNF
jgi:iron complex outermembrane receptor protein